MTKNMMKLEDLKVEDWPLEDSYNVVSDFLDSMPGTSRVTEPDLIIRDSSSKGVQVTEKVLSPWNQYSDLSGLEQKARGPRAADGLNIKLVCTKRSLQQEIASSSASTIAVDECGGTLRKCLYLYSKRRRSRTDITAYKRHEDR